MYLVNFPSAHSILAALLCEKESFSSETLTSPLIFPVQDFILVLSKSHLLEAFILIPNTIRERSLSNFVYHYSLRLDDVHMHVE